MAIIAFANTPLINYFRYKQSTVISSETNEVCQSITIIGEGLSPGQLDISTDTTPFNLTEGIAIELENTGGGGVYDGNYSIISFNDNNIIVGGQYVGDEIGGTWKILTNSKGSTAGDPLDAGIISFFDQDDKVTFQNTFSDRKLTILNPNPIILDSVGSFPPIYLLPKAYFITIFDKFNNLIATLDDYLPEDDTDDILGQTNFQNIFANYGFDTQIDLGDFSIESLPLDTPQNAISGGWFWEIDTTTTNEKNTYFFTALGDSSLPGNPKNTVTFKSTDNGSGDTLKNWVSVIGDYNWLQDTPVIFYIFDHIISGGISELTIQIRRTRNGVNETPITVGTIPISATRTQQTLPFTMPKLTDSNYSNDDTLSFLIVNPLNTDFEIELTGTWLEASSDGSIHISESSISEQGLKEWAGRGFNILKSIDKGSSKTGLPLVIGPSKISVWESTGAIFPAAPLSETFNYATKIDSFVSKVLVKNNSINKDNLVQTNRLIDYLRNNLTQSRSTILATSVSNVITITTSIGGFQKNTSSSSDPTRVAITKTVNEFIYKISAVIDLTNPAKLKLTFVDKFTPATQPFRPTYSGSSYNGQDIYFSGRQPIDSPIVSWFGSTSFRATASNRNSFPTSGQNIFSSNIIPQIINAGDGSNSAVVEFVFPDNMTTWLHSEDNNIFYDNTATTDANSAWTNTTQANPLYLNSLQDEQIRNVGSGGTPSTISIKHNYFAYNDINNNPSTQNDPPPRVIRYSIDGDTGQNIPTGTDSTLIISIDQNDSAEKIALKTSNAINTSWEEEITIISRPLNLTTVEYSGPQDDYIIVYFDLPATRPENPDTSRIPLYVGVGISDTIAQIASATKEVINDSTAGIPYWPDLGLPAFNSSNLLTYFITN